MVSERVRVGEREDDEKGRWGREVVIKGKEEAETGVESVGEGRGVKSGSALGTRVCRRRLGCSRGAVGGRQAEMLRKRHIREVLIT